MASGHQITGALIGGEGFRLNLACGKHGTKRFVVAFNQLRNQGDGTGENWIRGFKSEDDGVTWEQVGSSLRSRAQWLDTCVDGRGDASPYIYVAYMDVNANHTIARFNMQAETFDLENHFHVPVGAFGLSRIACNKHGELRVAISEGLVDFDVPTSTFIHEITPYTVAFSGETLAAGGQQPVPGIVFPIGSYAFMGIAPAAAAGAHPEGAEGWRYFMAESYQDGVNFPSRTVIFDDTGARVQFVNHADAYGRIGVRDRAGAPEPVLLTHQVGTSNYWSLLVSNDGGVSVQCSQGQVPTVTIQDVPLTTGGGALCGVGSDMYLMWFQGATLKASKASGSLASCAGWGAFETLLTVDEAAFFVEGATSVSDGIAVLYSRNDVSPTEFDAWFDVWFVLYPLGGGCPQPEVSTHECSGVPDADTTHNCGGDQRQGYSI